MTENSKVHLNIQSQQFNTLKSLLILAKIRNFAFGAVVFEAFVSWGFCLWGFCLLGVLSLGFLSMGLLSERLLYIGLPSAPPVLRNYQLIFLSKMFSLSMSLCVYQLVFLLKMFSFSTALMNLSVGNFIINHIASR